MQMDFHYYATWCAALLAGWEPEESAKIAYSAQMCDWCSRTFLTKLKAPKAAATTQLPMELAEARTDLIGLQDITRIWASFHFLPYDLHAEVRHASRLYKHKYRMICRPNGTLLRDTVLLAKGKGPQAAGVAMHVLADTWAHSNFAGTPSLVINNTNYYFYEMLEDGTQREIRFRHSASAPDDPERGLYTNSVYQSSENSIMNLGHGRAGHLPDYSYICYKYLPAWGNYEEIIKDNPADYRKAFMQMIYALQYLRGGIDSFEPDTYAEETAAPWMEKIQTILTRRQLDACREWKELGKEICGAELEEFDLEKYQDEYENAETEAKDDTFLGSFFLAAMAQKSMVTNAVFRSGSLLAGYSVDYDRHGFRGIRDYRKLVQQRREGAGR